MKSWLTIIYGVRKMGWVSCEEGWKAFIEAGPPWNYAEFKGTLFMNEEIYREICNTAIHSRQISDWISDEVYDKYHRGQREHGGNLARKNVLGHLTEEVVDTIVYLAVLHEQIGAIQEICMWALDEEHDGDGIVQGGALNAILNITMCGNEEGDIEKELTGEPQAKLFSETNHMRVKERINAWQTK